MIIKELMEQKGQKLELDHVIIQDYKKILDGTLRSFPKGTWEQPNARYYARIIIRYVVEEILNWTLEDLKTTSLDAIIRKFKLRGLTKGVYQQNSFLAFRDTYGELCKPWEHISVPKGFWDNDEIAKEAIVWFVEEFLKAKTEEEIVTGFTNENITKARLSGLKTTRFDNHLYKMYDFAYPNTIPYWKFRVAKGYWEENREIAKEIVDWFISDYLKAKTKQDICTGFNTENLINAGLKKLIKHFNSSPYELYNYCYPEQIHPWEFAGAVPKGFWDEPENAKKALEWFIQVYLQADTKEKIIKGFTIQNLNEAGLGWLNAKYGGNPGVLYDAVFPNLIPIWEFNSVPDGFWDDSKNVKEAVQWFIEVAVGEPTKENIRNHFTSENLWKYGIYAAMKQFNNSPYALYNFCYPNQMNPWEFRGAADKSYWDKRENVVKAVEWFVKEILQTNTMEETISKFNVNNLRAANLSYLLKQFNHSPFALYQFVYQDDNAVPWYFSNVPNHYWDDSENVRTALEWFFNLHNADTIPKKIQSMTTRSLRENGLNGLLRKGGVYVLFNEVYPNQITEERFNSYK